MVYLLCMAFLLGYGIYNLISTVQHPWEQDFTTFMIAVCGALFFALATPLILWSSVNKYQKRYERVHGDASAEMEFFFEEDRIVRRVIQTQEEGSYGYHLISQVIVSKKYYFIHADGRCFILDKQNFLQGDASEFLQFLIKKAPGAELIRT